MRISTLLIPLGALSLAACAERTGSAAPDASPTALADVIDREDPYGLNAMVRALSVEDPRRVTQISPDIQVKFLGRRNVISEGEPVAPTYEPQRPGNAEDTREMPATAFGPERLRLFNAQTRNEFQVTISARLLKAIGDAGLRAGLNTATEGVDDPADAERPDGGVHGTAFEVAQLPGTSGFETTGWSKGVDSRIPWVITTVWPRRAVAQFKYGGNESACTGTLIGPRHVITAAHCLVPIGTDDWYSFTVTPARSGPAGAPYGSSFAFPGPGVWFVTPDEWRDPQKKNKGQWDWGMVMLPDRLGDKTGWFGFFAESFNALISNNHYNRGYPSCKASNPDRPAACQTAVMYGDLQPCIIGGTDYPGPDGWTRLAGLSCDASPGHDGSPVYDYKFDPSLGQQVPVVSLVMALYVCSTCSATDYYPNWAVRLTPTNMSTILMFRQMFP